MSIEMWTTGLSHVSVAPRAAVRAEAEGWDGMVVVDSQNLSGDPFVGLALAARETSRLALGTGVTNPATRHPAAAAAAIASVHVASGGRATLGVGRGDSALAHLGFAPAPLADLDRFVRITRAYLRGEPVSFDDLRAYEREGARSIDVLGLANRPADSRLHWLPADLAPVAVDVVATGPRAIALAGAAADGVWLAVGADPERVGWAASAAVDAGATRLAAFVNVVCHPDLSMARRLASGGLTTFARFSAMDGKVRTPIDDASRETLQNVHRAYDMERHTRAGSPQAAQLTDEFIDRFGIVGSPDHCIARLRELACLGIERFIVVGPSIDADRDEAGVARRLFVDTVLPALTSTRSTSTSVASTSVASASTESAHAS
jgi:5,10-methylenetetrahydromethanopterin reductase